jgi:hypothetical protein
MCLTSTEINNTASRFSLGFASVVRRIAEGEPQLQLPLHRLDDDLSFRQMPQFEPDHNQLTNPQQFTRWQTASRYPPTTSRPKGAARVKRRPFRGAA